MTLLNRVKCWWYGHNYETRWFRRDLPGGTWYMKMGCEVCSRCNDGIADFVRAQAQINIADAGRGGLMVHVCPKCDGERRLDEGVYFELCKCSHSEQYEMVRRSTSNFCLKCKAAICQRKRICPTCNGKGFVKS